MFKRFLIFTLLFLYQTNSKSASTVSQDFNQKYVSKYMSALISYGNQDNKRSIEYFNSSKKLINLHPNFLNNYIYSLVEYGKINQAIKAISQFDKSKSKIFFEANIISIIGEIKNKNFENAKQKILEIENYQNQTNLEIFIQNTLKSYLEVFVNKKIETKSQNYGTLSLISLAFQEAYLENNYNSKYFLKLMNSEDGDYSRYLFFHLTDIINKNDTELAIEISDTINYYESTLLLSQSKKWIENRNFNKFKKYFSFNSEEDILAEFFFLISNLYSSQENYKQSNFYLNIANYLNPKFYFNLTMLVENYYMIEDFEKSKSILNNFQKDDQIYQWYKIKKIAQIISIQKNENLSIKYIEDNFKKISKPDSKMFYDLANLYRQFKMYNKSIDNYNLILDRFQLDDLSKASILYRRGTSYERLGNYSASDKDLLNSLKLNYDEAYVLNYLAYNWLERNHKIVDAIDMLKKANSLKPDDAFICDSLGWAYYLNGNLFDAEKFILKALELKPNDPVIMDHYGDILWKLGNKLQAKYFWKNAIKFEDSEDIDFKYINKKLLYGLS